MIDLHNDYDPLREIESLVRSAGDYVHATDDLRPRVLETARVQYGERRARRFIRQIALALVLWTLCANSGLHNSDIALAQQISGTERMFQRVEAKAADSGDYGSGFVDAFLELRKEQAQILRMAL